MSNEIEMQGDLLDYVWIEDYRNGVIKSKGFHFSRRYSYSYDAKTCTLSRTKLENNKGYIRCFYDKNIEVNAVVGANGSGKTSLLRAVFDAMHLRFVYDETKKSAPPKKIIIAFQDGFVYCVYDNLEFEQMRLSGNKSECRFNGKNKQNTIHLWQMLYRHCYYCSFSLDYSIYDDYVLDCSSMESYNNDPLSNYDISTSSLVHPLNATGFEKFEKTTVENYFYEENRKQLYLVGFYDWDEKIFQKIFGFDLPHILYVSIKQAAKIVSQLKPNYRTPQEFVANLGRINSKSLETPLDELKGYFSLPDLTDKKCDLEIFKEKIAFGLVAVIIRICTYSLIQHSKASDENLHNMMVEFCEKAKGTENNKLWLKMKNIYIHAKSHYLNYDNNNEEWEKDISSLAHIIELLENTVHHNYDNSKITLVYDDFELPVPAIDFVSSYFRFGNYFNIINLSWKLSSGEIARLALFARIYNALKNRKKDNILILLDEADMLLHPRWQQTFVKSTVGFAKEMIRKGYAKRIQIVIATHSPIMLSDIPRQNTLFLTEDQNEPSETFASNIFALYQSSFFIDDIGIGSFAKKKLTELVEWIHESPENSSKTNKDLEKMIDMVGDDYLKAKLKKEFLIYRLKDNSEQSVNNELRARIRELEKQLASVQNTEEKTGNDSD